MPNPSTSPETSPANQPSRFRSVQPSILQPPSSNPPLVLGIDVGTQGARVVACGPDGRVVAQASEGFPAATAGLPPRWAEQDPETWWAAVVTCLGRLVGELGAQQVGGIAALAVTSTSGTVLPVDANGRPLRPALMYNDGRAGAEADQVQAAGRDQAAALGYRFNASFALSKILWLRLHEPELFAASTRFIHAADFITGRLTGEYGLTDFSNALKTGYNLIDETWPAFIETDLGIPLARLPQVRRPGELLAPLSPACATATGLPAGLPVLAGMTDGCTSQISTGAMAPGDWNSTLGTTLVLKGVTETLLRDPQDRIYSHRHPDGFWLPGGASNTGGEAMAQRFPRERWETLNDRALEAAPTGLVIYPLARQGERFPFARPDAEGFSLGEAAGEAAAYAATLEGVAYVERLAYEVLAGIGATIGETVYNAGGATRSRPWSQLRADILGRVLARPEVTGGAMGAAIIAAAGAWYGGIIPATRAMVRIVERVEPRPALAAAYTETYRRFKEACVERGYI